MIGRLFFLLLLLLIPVTARAQNSSKEIFAEARAAAAGSAASIDLYQRYTRMEPGDAWGFLALAESYAAARRFRDAGTALARAYALAPGEEDVAIVKARIERARRNALPSVKPTALLTRDSDANTSIQIGAAGDAVLTNAIRAGITGARVTTGDGTTSATVDNAAATIALKSPTVRWSTEVGAARFTHLRTRAVAVGQTRLRWSKDLRGFTADVRVRHAPITNVYSLVNAEALLTEARGLLDIPITGALKVRATGQLGRIETGTLTPIAAPRPGRGNQTQFTRLVDRNTRFGYGGGVVLPYAPVAEAALIGYRLQYDDAGTGQYFAPEHVDVIELGTYAESYRFDPFTIAVDAGAGLQRAKAFDLPESRVTPAYRLWAQAGYPLARYVDLHAEVDYYRSQLSTVATSAGWSSFTAGMSLRWLMN